MTFPPGDITYLDRFDRSDGNVWAGAGATLWDDIGRDGAESKLRIIDGKLKVSAQGGGFTNESVADFIRGFKVETLGGGFGVSFGYRWTGSGATGNGYFWSLAGGTWRFYKSVAGVLTEIGNQAVDGLFANCRVAFRVVGSTHEVYVGTARTFPETPAASFTDSTYTSAGAVLVELDNTSWVLDDYFSASNVAPTSGVTIIVDPDHPDASDDYNRTQGSDPDTPFRTVQEALWHAKAAPDWHDEILVKVCETEDLGDANDPHIQPALDYRSADRSATADGWLYGDNSGNEPIIVRGDVTPLDVRAWDGLFDDAPRPKIKSFSSRDLNNWEFHDLQFGYDVDSGDDHNTFGVHERVTDLAFRRCMATGGLAWVRHWTDSFTVEDCWIRSPFPSSPSGVHDACGLRFDGAPAEGTGYSIGQLHVTGGFHDFIRGDDSIFVGGVDSTEDPLWDTAEVLVEETVFYNVNGDGEFHDDAVQVTFHPRAIVDRCMFISCDTGFMATDGHCGYLRFTRNLTVGMPTPVQIQGADEVVIAHNTCSHADSEIKNASLMFYDRTVLAERTLATIVNNVIGGFYTPNTPLASYFRSGSVIENNIVQSDPGLVTPYGTNLPGISEFGHSARLDVIPNASVALDRDLDRFWELANSPTDGPGIGQGGTYDLGFDLDVDLLGRAYASPPDAGCFQSDPGTAVAPVPRSPYVTARTPAVSATGVPASITVTATLYPVPGAEINPETVDTSTAYVTDSADQTIPAVVTLSDPADGHQTITVDLRSSLSPEIDGELYPLVTYTVHLTGGIQDSDGSALTATTWSFRVIGPVGPAIAVPADGSQSFTLEADPRFHVGATVYLYRGAGLVPISPFPVTSAVVAADSTTTFDGLDVNAPYLAGFSAAGPFISFRT